MALTDIEVKKAKAKERPYRLSDGGGLYLWLTPPGGKLWRWGTCMRARRSLCPLASIQTSRSQLRENAMPKLEDSSRRASIQWRGGRLKRRLCVKLLKTPSRVWQRVGWSIGGKGRALVMWKGLGAD